jgi:hypothetical protein
MWLRISAFLTSIALPSLFCACTSTQTSVTAPTASRCDISISNTPSSFTAAGGTGTVTVSTARDCTWTVATEAGWVSITGARSGQGEASIPFSVLSNPVPSPRSGEIVVVSQRVQLSQAAAPCQFSLSRSGDRIAAAGGRLSFDVSTLSGCGWSASTSQNWIAISSGQSGNANGSVGLSIAANTGGARTGQVTVGGQSYTVTQDEAPVPPPAPAPPAPAPTPPAPAPPAPAPPAPAPSPTPAPPPAPTPAPSPSTPVHIEGIALSVTGTCPSVGFFVGTTSVTGSQSTDYDKKCSDLKNGSRVEIDGTRLGSGPVSATKIKIRN